MIYTDENITLIGKWENDKKVGEGIFTVLWRTIKS